MKPKIRNILSASLLLAPVGEPLLLSAIGVSTATAAILVRSAPASAQQELDVSEMAKAITVRIEGSTQGSGVIVKREGERYTILTAWHVIKSNRAGEEVGIFTPDKKQHQLEQGSIKRIGVIDMAVLTFTSRDDYSVAALGDIQSVRYSQPIYVAGFPLRSSQNLRYEPGEVVANADVGIDQGYQLLYDNKTERGMSGGVILTKQGKLIGLHGRGERDERESSIGGHVIKTGVNQGVPISYYQAFESGKPVKINTTPKTADDYLAQARASIGINGREQSVIRLASKSLLLRETSEGFFLIGTTSLYLDKPKDAVESFSQAIRIDPTLTPAYSNRANGYIDTGSFKQALADLDKAIEMNSDGFRKHIYLFNRGLLKGKSLQNPEEALIDFSESIRHQPAFAPAYNGRGFAKEELNDYQGAISDYNKAIELNPRIEVAYINRAFLKLKLQDNDGAIMDFESFITLNPNNRTPRLAHLIAELYFKEANKARNEGDLKDASELYTMSISYKETVQAYTNRGVVRKNLGKLVESISDHNKAISIDPSSSYSYFNRGNSFYATEQYESACKDYKKAVSLGMQPAAQWLMSEKGSWCRNMQ